jgi:molybdopterin/thiamine biosynthesis adenylyltransferase/TusA-related sulfurtransferase
VVRALLIGAGGLGVPAAWSLAARGGVALSIWDPDRVETSNLHRQILYREADVGRPKALVAQERLQAQFPGLELEVQVDAFGPHAASQLANFDVVLDGTDHFEVKLELHDLCLDAGVPYVFGGVLGTEGQVLGVRPGQSACLRCLFDEAPPPGAAATCAEVGILGPIAGIVAAEQTRVALGLLADHPGGQLWSYDGIRDRARVIPIPRMSDCRGCGARRHLRGVLEAPPTFAEGEEADTLDLSGRSCPTTFIETNKRLQGLPPGARLWVQLTSDESARSVPRSCVAAGHKVLAQRVDGRHHFVLLQRAEGN